MEKNSSKTTRKGKSSLVLRVRDSLNGKHARLRLVKVSKPAASGSFLGQPEQQEWRTEQESAPEVSVCAKFLPPTSWVTHTPRPKPKPRLKKNGSVAK
eukprot:216679-Amphidinium_carterae.1